MAFKRVHVCFSEPHKQGSLIKCLVHIVLPNGEDEVWSCSPDAAGSSISIISASKLEVVDTIIVSEQPVNSACQLSETVWLGCFGTIIEISIASHKAAFLFFT